MALRERLLAAVPPPCILDVTPDSIQNYLGFHTVEHAVRDFEAALWPEAAAVCELHGWHDAFHSRNQAVSFKKVLLHLVASFQQLESNLRQLANVFYEDPRRTPAPLCGASDELGAALLRTRGALAVATDARVLAKRICAMPRHPEEWSDALRVRLEQLSGFAALRKARRFLGAGAPATPLATQSGIGESSGYDALRRGLSEAARAGRAPPGAAADELAAFAEKVLIGRGVAKALAVRRLVLELGDVFGALADGCEGALIALGCAQPGDALEAAAEAGPPAAAAHGAEAVARPGGEGALLAFAQRRLAHTLTLEAIRDAARDVAHWMRHISAADTPGDKAASRAFVGSDVCGALVAPPDFALSLSLAALQPVAEEHRLRLHRLIAAEGWPPPSRPLLAPAEADGGGGGGGGGAQCAACGGRFSRTVVSRGICLGCERARRALDRCPFGAPPTPAPTPTSGGAALAPAPGARSACLAALWCPHQKRCGACEPGVSCDACRFHRADGDGVGALAARLGVSRLFLDFDRTLCSTRAGAAPQLGVHAADAGLQELVLEALARGTPSCCVVTRNGRADEIGAWLAHHRVPVPVVVASSKSGVDKADAILARLGAGECGLFVDDERSEHADRRLRECERLHRVLFHRVVSVPGTRK